MNILESISKNHYVATDVQVEQLAREHYTVSEQLTTSNSTYLRILIAGCKAVLGAKTRKPLDADSQLLVVEKVHNRYYSAVLRGITTPDIEADDSLPKQERGRRQLERNSRSSFARSSATTLRNFVRVGGDVRALDPETASKAQLRKLVSESQGESPVDKLADRISKAEKSLMNALKAQIRKDPDQGAAIIEAILERLQAALDDAEPHEPMVASAPRDRGQTRTRVGMPIIRLPERQPE